MLLVNSQPEVIRLGNAADMLAAVDTAFELLLKIDGPLDEKIVGVCPNVVLVELLVISQAEVIIAGKFPVCVGAASVEPPITLVVDEAFISVVFEGEVVIDDVAVKVDLLLVA